MGGKAKILNESEKNAVVGRLLAKSWTLTRIGAELGHSKQTVSNAVSGRFNTPEAKKIRTFVLDKIDVVGFSPWAV